MSTDVTRIRIETMRHLADHFDKLRHVGGSPELDRALWHAAGFMREQATWVEQGKVHIFDGLRDTAENERWRTVLADLTDPDPCWFDHNGGCQAHGFLSLQPGEKCPQAEAKELLGTADALDDDATPAQVQP